MKANELRVGNWVFNGRNIRVIPTQIEWFSEGVYDLLPIPLTEEWLLKFGFKKESINELYLTINDNNGLFIWVDLNTLHPIAELIDSSDRVVVNHIEYIHELQNLYFALTGEELKLLKDE